MGDQARVMAKLAELPEILRAAEVLYRNDLIGIEPAALVKRFVEANPDINAYIAETEESA